MKTYYLFRMTQGPVVEVEEIEGDPLRRKTYRLRHVLRHSPTGLEFGYAGSGPADTALSILTDLVGRGIANRHYQHFKFEFIARDRQELIITEAEIRAWLVKAMLRYEHRPAEISRT